MKSGKIVLLTLVAVVVLGAVGFGAFAWSGWYNIGADDHHWPATYKALQTVRDRSIEVHSRNIKVPDLSDPGLILKGAGQYAAMCTSCHLEPGKEDSELRKGMYPQPPNLSKMHVPPREAFWVIKHGIKMSAMPAWGMAGHDDQTIWSMVAFVEKLPGMTPAEYQAIVAKAPPDEDMDESGGHHHGHEHGVSAAAASTVSGAPASGTSTSLPPSGESTKHGSH